MSDKKYPVKTKTTNYQKHKINNNLEGQNFTNMKKLILTDTGQIN